MDNVMLLDCTLRDGGYYNSWDFEPGLVEDYLKAMSEISVDYVELGLRSFEKNGFKGAFAYTTDSFIRSLSIPNNLKLGVMVNASELLKYSEGLKAALTKLFTPEKESPITLVRIACHVYEFKEVLPAATWLKEQGYTVGFNLMQIADKTPEQIKELAGAANEYPVDVLYFADSMGGLTPENTTSIINTIREVWNGPLGIHTHDNMEFALANSKRAVEEGVTWVDGTVTGMGRGPGNAKTEYLAIELKQNQNINTTPLLKVIDNYFKPMQDKYGWGTNTYYYLAGKYGIHPTYIQEMISDSRYDVDDLLIVIEYLKSHGGKKFSINTLDAARNFYEGSPKGSWRPSSVLSGREVLIVGAGPSLSKHKQAIEDYIRKTNPYVIALNTNKGISSKLVDARAASHPIRILADSNTHKTLSQPVIMPLSMMTNRIKESYYQMKVFDFGLAVEENTFGFEECYGILPNSLVLSYALAVAASGNASRITLAGFDGYGVGDARTEEVNQIFKYFLDTENAPPIIAITPTQYKIQSSSVYAF